MLQSHVQEFGVAAGWSAAGPSQWEQLVQEQQVMDKKSCIRTLCAILVWASENYNKMWGDMRHYNLEIDLSSDCVVCICGVVKYFFLFVSGIAFRKDTLKQSKKKKF